MKVVELKRVLDWAVKKGMSELPVALTVTYDDLSYNADLSSAGRAFRDDEGNCFDELAGSEEVNYPSEGQTYLEPNDDDEEVFNLRGLV